MRLVKLFFLKFTQSFFCGFDTAEFCPEWVSETLLSEKTFKIFRGNRIGSESFRRPGGFANFQTDGEISFAELETPKFQLRAQKGLTDLF